MFAKMSRFTMFTIAMVMLASASASCIVEPDANGVVTADQITAALAPGTTVLTNHAFVQSHCNNPVRKVTIPDHITEMSWYTFNGCTDLVEVNMPASLTKMGGYTFKGCTSLKTVIFPAGLTEMGYETFDGCTDIAVVCGATDLVWTPPASGYYSGTSSGNWFQNTGNTLGQRLNLNADLTTACNLISAPGACAIDPDHHGVVTAAQITAHLAQRLAPRHRTYLPSDLFKNCLTLITVNLPPTLTMMGHDVFNECISLRTVNGLGSTALTFMGMRTFEQCTSLVSIDLPPTLTTMGDDTFKQCSRLHTINGLGSTALTTMGMRTFEQCTSLVSIDLPPTLTSMGSDTFTQCSSLTNISFPAGLTSMAGETFIGCDSLHASYCNGIPCTEALSDANICGATGLTALPSWAFGTWGYIDLSNLNSALTTACPTTSSVANEEADACSARCCKGTWSLPTSASSSCTPAADGLIIVMHTTTSGHSHHRCYEDEGHANKCRCQCADSASDFTADNRT